MDDSGRIFLGTRQMKKTGPASRSLTIPPVFFKHTGIDDIKKVTFNMYLDPKNNSLIIEFSKVIDLDDPEYEEVVEEANFQDAMNDSATEEVEEMMLEEEGIKIN